MHRRVRHLFFLLLALGLFWFYLSGGVRPCLAQETKSPLDLRENDGGQPNAGEPNTSLSRFPKDLWENFLAVFNERNVKPLLIGSAVTGSVALLDDEIHGYFENRNHSTAFTEIGEFMGKAYVLTPAVGGLLVAGQFSRPGRFRSFSYELAHGYVLTNALAGALKVAVGRERPISS